MVVFPRWKIFVVCAVLLTSVAFVLPNVLPQSAVDKLPNWMPERRVNLGLDLQGGASLLMEVDLAFAAEERVGSVLESVRERLRSARIGYQNLSIVDEQVVFDLRNPEDSDRARKLLAQLSPDLVVSVDSPRVFASFSENSTLQWRARLVEQSIEITRARLDETGTREPAIQRQDQAG